MKVTHSMCGPHGDSDTIFGPVRHFGWTCLLALLFNGFSTLSLG